MALQPTWPPDIPDAAQNEICKITDYRGGDCLDVRWFQSSGFLCRVAHVSWREIAHEQRFVVFLMPDEERSELSGP